MLLEHDFKIVAALFTSNRAKVMNSPTPQKVRNVFLVQNIQQCLRGILHQLYLCCEPIVRTCASVRVCVHLVFVGCLPGRHYWLQQGVDSGQDPGYRPGT